MNTKSITLLKNKTVIFLDDKGIPHYGTVKKECRISFGPKRNIKTGTTVKRSSFQGYIIHQTFKRTGLKHIKEHRVTTNNILTVLVRNKEIPISEFLSTEG